MTMRQNNWTLGAYCESYCRIVTGHHTLEDRSVFPHLRRSRARRSARCSTGSSEEHDVIHDVLERVRPGAGARWSATTAPAGAASTR